MRRILRALRRDRRGVTAVEYALIAGLVGAVLLVAVGTFGDRVQDLFGAMSDRVEQTRDRIAQSRDGR